MATTGILNVYNDNPTATTFAVQNNNIDGLPGGNSSKGTFVLQAYSSISFTLICTGIEQSWFAVGIYNDDANWVVYNIGEPGGVSCASTGNGTRYNLFWANTTISQTGQAIEGSSVATFQACFGLPTATVPPIVNSAIQANLAAALSWLNTGPTFTFGGLTVLVQSITPNTTLSCYYGSFAPVPGASQQAIARIMLCLNNANVNMVVGSGDLRAPFTLTASPIFLDLGAIITYSVPTNSKQPIALSVNVTSLSVSLPGYSLSGDGVFTLGEILALNFSWLGAAVALGYLTNSNLEVILNGPANSSFMSAVQSGLNQALSSDL